ncbi:MAG: TRAP transporter substrate-binding protein [Kiritimatiellia bacterium]|jgi:tripartite ATP-independent transporter DctP family solute receptor|nr:TRAP transporter substrate-binding protein [Kiritimatiellia bacterium]
MINRSVSFFFAGTLTGILVACGLGAFVIRPPRAETGGGGGDRTVVLKLAHGLDESHPVHQGMAFMKKRLEELTGGRATIDLYSGGVLGGETECLEQVQKGELAMTKVSTAAIEAFIPEMKVFSVPFVFRDANHFWNTLHGPVGKRLLTLGAERSFRGLCYYDSGDRNFYTTKKPVRSVEDLRGMKVRVMNSRTAMDMINAMGGSPCPINWGELYTALAQGTVDAAENNPPSFVTSRHFEVCKYFILSAHQRIPDMLIISLKTWDRLPLEIRQALQQAADESESFQRVLWAETTEKSLADSRAKSVEIITPDIASFRKACAPILAHKDYADIRRIYNEIQEVR